MFFAFELPSHRVGVGDKKGYAKPLKQRMLSWESDANYAFVIRSVPTDKAVGYGSKYFFATTPFPSITASFYNLTKMDRPLYSYTVAFPRLVEYTDNINQSTSFVDFSGNPNAWNTSLTTFDQNGTSVTNGTVCYKQGVSVCFYGFLTSQPINTTDGQRLRPNGFKFSFSVSGFQYKLTNSKLALLTFVQSDKNKMVHRRENKTLEIGSSGTFTWVETVKINGNTDAAVTSSLANVTLDLPPPPPRKNGTGSKDDNGGGKSGGNSDGKNSTGTPPLPMKINMEVVAFTFESVQPSSLYWDPEIAMDESTLAEQDATTTTSTGAVNQAAGSPVVSMATLFLISLSLMISLTF
jgi:hypothetical protein